MKKDYTHITLVLDRSGSMAEIQSDVVGGVNTFVDAQRGVAGECSFTLVQFDTQNPYEVLHNFKALRDVAAMKREDFVPRGGTPLYDALGRGIADLGERLSKMAEGERPDKVVFVTMTDGMENASREYSRERVAAMTKEQREKYNWQFVYLGADQDAMAVGTGLGSAAAHSARYLKQNIGNAMGMSSRKLAAYRASGKVADLNYSDQEREDLLKNDATRAASKGPDKP